MKKTSQKDEHREQSKNRRKLVRGKKSLGQNFLTSTKIASNIVRAASVNAEDTVLEIGPGRGMLTRELLNTGAHVVAIEKDTELIPIVQEKFADEIKSNQLELIEGDALDFERQASFASFKIVANIPYYITGEIIRKFLTIASQPSSMTLLVQKEVAERMVAKNGKESILSLSVKVYGKPKLVAKVSRRFFSPKPKVDSAILHIGDISRNFFKQKACLRRQCPTFYCSATPTKLRDNLFCNRENQNISEEQFFKVIKAGFAQKRKKLVNNLSVLMPKEEVLKIFKYLNIEENTRAEDVQLDIWKVIVASLFYNFDNSGRPSRKIEQ